MPILYVGQTDELRKRIDQHEKAKDFWDLCIVFVSSNNFLNRAHVTWLEWALYKRALELNQCKLDNSQVPQEPSLSEADKADMLVFSRQMLQVLPLVNVRAFEKVKSVATTNIQPQPTAKGQRDTVIVPARKDGFDKVFLAENCWYAIRIGGGMLDKIKFIAAYQSQPISAITHIATVDRIEPYGDTGKYKVIFSAPATKIGPIPYGNAQSGTMQGTRYVSRERLDKAQTVEDLFS